MEIVCRDRAEPYADGARRGAPNALQVVDRFHLIRNLLDVLQRVFEGHRSALYAGKTESFEVVHVIDPLSNNNTPIETESSIVVLQEAELELSEVGQQRHENYQKAQELYEQGWTYRAIGKHLGIRRQTVSRYVNASTFPDRRRASKLDPYKPYILDRWNAGCRTGTVLWDEIKALGYTGKRSMMLDYITRLRKAQGLPPRSRVYAARDAVSDRRSGRLSPRQAALIVLRRNLKSEEQQLIDRIRAAHVELEEAITLSQDFTQMLRAKRSCDF